MTYDRPRSCYADDVFPSGRFLRLLPLLELWHSIIHCFFICSCGLSQKRGVLVLKAALEGIRVLELTQIMAGPFCGMLLADLGAEVIKIENPHGGDDSRRMAPPYYNGESAAFIAMNRNKYGMALNIRTPEGKELLWRLIATADVLIENF